MIVRKTCAGLMLVFATALPTLAQADDLFAGLEKGCVSLHVKAGFKVQQGRALCAQFSAEEKHCLIATFRQAHNFYRAQSICLQVEGSNDAPYGESPYPWARVGVGFCNQNPGHISCQDRYILGW